MVNLSRIGRAHLSKSMTRISQRDEGRNTVVSGVPYGADSVCPHYTRPALNSRHDALACISAAFEPHFKASSLRCILINRVSGTVEPGVNDPGFCCVKSKSASVIVELPYSAEDNAEIRT